jgi:uncharacterized protein (DUF1330 family)
MSRYFLAVMDKKDAATFSEYQQKAKELVAPLDVNLLAVTESVDTVAGAFNATTLVLLEFPDEAEFRKWWDSDEYKAITPLREASADTRFAVTFGD